MPCFFIIFRVTILIKRDYNELRVSPQNGLVAICINFSEFPYFEAVEVTNDAYRIVIYL